MVDGGELSQHQGCAGGELERPAGKAEEEGGEGQEEDSTVEAVEDWCWWLKGRPAMVKWWFLAGPG